MARDATAWVPWAGVGLGLAAGLATALRPRPEWELGGQVAVITGGSRGLGLLLARELGRHGCQLAICARDEAELARARADLESRGMTVHTVRCNVAERAEVERFIAEVVRRFGGIDLLVNNAGTIKVGPVELMTVGDFEDAMRVNFWGMVYPTLSALPIMRAQGGGRIVNITSIGGKVSVPHLLPYNCAKFAAVAFSEGLRAELARDGITVVTVVPGLMRTRGDPLGARLGPRTPPRPLSGPDDRRPSSGQSARPPDAGGRQPERRPGPRGAVPGTIGRRPDLDAPRTRRRGPLRPAPGAPRPGQRSVHEATRGG